jgi:hypothetical protein
MAIVIVDEIRDMMFKNKIKLLIIEGERPISDREIKMNVLYNSSYFLIKNVYYKFTEILE